jgi:hypothetical protein
MASTIQVEVVSAEESVFLERRLSLSYQESLVI